jgi:nitrite reductase (NADH) small subunit
MTAFPDTIAAPAPATRFSPPPGSWVTVCPVRRLLPERAVAALVHGKHVAVVRTAEGGVYAVDNRDPFTGASVLSRGIVGSRDADPGIPTLASPLHKQVFDLPTGRCVDDPAVSVAVYPVRVVGDMVQVSSSAVPRTTA